MEGAVRFHGHLGPFLVLGLKAGLFANEVLGKDCFKTRAVVVTKPAPPFSCFVDGIQFATCCTMGKGNIELNKGDSLSVLFTKGTKTVQLRLKTYILKSLKEASLKTRLDKTAEDFSKKPVQALFEIRQRI